MGAVIDFRAYRRARRGTHDRTPERAHHADRGRQGRGLVTIGVVSEELLRRLTEER